MKFRILFAALAMILAVTTGWAQEKKTSEEKPASGTAPAAQPAPEQAPAPVHGFTITPEDAAKKNPMRFSQISVEHGKKMYATQCAMCHGEKGDGKGEMVEEMKINPPDFTKPETLAKRTDGELFKIIQVGDATMPSQGSRMSDTHKWEIVNYLRSLAGKTPLKSTEDELQQGTVVVKEKN
ncbi:MAG TPA: c-type cytochrome [Terriglobia bacterium]|nr:c-type cytochrome [Terriglobia bacterium]